MNNFTDPSIIESLKDESILEGSNLTVTCQVKQGNPTEESISWARTNGFKKWRGKYLLINNVSRADDTNYTCILTTRIRPTFGDEAVIVNNRTFHLNVFCKYVK